jgi:uncharacterized RDD family membrane protein YckC
MYSNHTIYTKYETILDRFLAGIIDGVIFMPILLADYYMDIDFSDKYIFVLWVIASDLLQICYSVYFHATTGQTIGKKMLKIKVVDINEQNTIGFKRAFLRETPYLTIDLIAISYFIWYTHDLLTVSEETSIGYENLIGMMMLLYIAVAFITLIRNAKRRTVHDFLAGSVVVHVK